MSHDIFVEFGSIVIIIIIINLLPQFLRICLRESFLERRGGFIASNILVL